jgi:hypothetical protein
MNNRFEATNIDEVEEAVKRFNDFHDDYVAGIEIKFENYKGLNDDGVSTGIKNADKTIILTVNTYPYGKEHKQFVRVEFKNVKSFEIVSSVKDSGPKAGPTWGILDTLILPDGNDIKWEFGFICGDTNGDTKFLVICSKIVFHKQIS